jgi:hypothetical protein
MIMGRKTLLGAIILTVLSLFFPAPAEAGLDVSVSLSVFFDELSPYGQWVTIGSYGEVWCPRDMPAGWQPYLNGKWCFTHYGWTWVSFDPWGGDPYHYGTWVFTDDWGWVWVPGTIWAPAWVTWCDDGTYIGWAPVPPTLSVSVAGSAGASVFLPPRNYVFVPVRSFVGVDARAVRVDPVRNVTLVSHARRFTSFGVSGGIVRTGGPGISRIRKITGIPVATATLSQASDSFVKKRKRVGFCETGRSRTSGWAARYGCSAGCTA